MKSGAICGTCGEDNWANHKCPPKGDTKPREFWIEPRNGGPTHTSAWTSLQTFYNQPTDHLVHVIEYSAYEELGEKAARSAISGIKSLARVEELERELAAAKAYRNMETEALERVKAELAAATAKLSACEQELRDMKNLVCNLSDLKT